MSDDETREPDEAGVEKPDLPTCRKCGGEYLWLPSPFITAMAGPIPVCPRCDLPTAAEGGPEQGYPGPDRIPRMLLSKKRPPNDDPKK